MDDPTGRMMTVLFGMYDSKDVSNDEILDCAVVCLLRCHDAISAFTSNQRFLEAYRQFQYCEDILKERNTERKIITKFSSTSHDAEVFRQLEARTMLLHNRFEAMRTNVQSFDVKQRRDIRDSKTYTAENVGPPRTPNHGSGGVLSATRRKRSSSIVGEQLRRISSAQLQIRDVPELGTLDAAPTISQKVSDFDRGADSTGSILPHIMKVDMRVQQVSPSKHPEPLESQGKPGLGWREKSNFHIARAYEVLQNARQSVVDMKARTEAIQRNREAAVNATLVDAQRATSRALSAKSREPSPERQPQQEPLKPHPPARRASKSAEKREAELRHAEEALLRRLDNSAQKVSRSRAGSLDPSASMHQASENASSSPQSSPQRLSKSLTNLVLRRRSTKNSPSKADADSLISMQNKRAPYRKLDVQHPLYDVFLQESRMMSLRSPKPPGNDEDDTGNSEEHPVSGESVVADLPESMLSQGNDALPMGNAISPVAADSSVMAFKLDERLRKLQSSRSSRAAVLSVAAQERLEQRATALISEGKLFSPQPPIRMTNDDLERFLTAETALLVKQKRTNSFFFPSLLDTEPVSVPIVWSSYDALCDVADWTTLSARELFSNLELCVASLRLQCWWRKQRAIAELRRRAHAAQTYTINHHKELEAAAVVVRAFRVLVSKRRVEAISKRVAHVNDQRIELELNRNLLNNAFPISLVAPLPDEDGGEGGGGATATLTPWLGGPSALNMNASWRASTSRSPYKRRGKSRSVANSASLSKIANESQWETQYNSVLPRAEGFPDRPFHNPFPRLHPHYENLHELQRKVAARAIAAAIHTYIFRCVEELQQTADRCMRHILTGQYEADNEWGGDELEPFAAPFGSDGGLLAKYSGDIVERVERRARGEEGSTEFVQLCNVKLSELEAARKKEEEARQAAIDQEMDRHRRAAEQELLELQHRNQMVLLVQRVGRGFRRRHWLSQSYSSLQEHNHRANLRGMRIERFSLSLSGVTSGSSTPTTRTPKSEGFVVNKEVLLLISSRNPDLMPERKREIAAHREAAVTQVQRYLRALSSWRYTHIRSKNVCAIRIQRSWRRIWKKRCDAEWCRTQLRTEFVIQSYM